MFRVLTQLTKTVFSGFNTAGKVVRKHDWKNPNYKYETLTHPDYPYLHGSEFLKEMLFPAIKDGNKQQIVHVMNHIARHKVQNIESYKIVLNIAKKALKNLDLILF